MFGRQIGSLVLRVDEQHQKMLRHRVPEVDHAGAASFSPTACGPAKLPQAARSGDDSPRLRVTDKFQLKVSVVFIAQQITNSRRESPRLHDHHAGTIRQWRTQRKAGSGASNDPRLSGRRTECSLDNERSSRRSKRWLDGSLTL